MKPAFKTWLLSCFAKVRHWRIFAACAGGARTYLRQYERVHRYDRERNGEKHLLETLAPIFRDRRAVLFDVGAHTGSWADLALAAFEDCTCHCFEISPATFELLRKKYSATQRVVLNPTGLSDRPGEVDLHHSRDRTDVSSLHLRLDGVVYETVRSLVTTGEVYARENGVDHVDVLKIDTEGHEYSVLAGFGALLAEGRIAVIQFEHNVFAVAARVFLKDFHDLLVPHGYLLGRLGPRGVAFKPYDIYTDEYFGGANFVAVHGSRPDLIEALRPA